MSARSPPRRVVHGDDLLYEFFQNVLREDDPSFAGVPQLLLETMGVWWPVELFQEMPVLLPFVVRDPRCRGQRVHGPAGRVVEPGMQRDTSATTTRWSKGLPRALSVRGPRSRRIAGARLGTEFVAAHIWRVTPRARSARESQPNTEHIRAELGVAARTDREADRSRRQHRAAGCSSDESRHLPRRKGVATSCKPGSRRPGRCFQTPCARSRR